MECVFCGCERLGSPDEPPALGSAIVCGACSSLHVLDANAADPDEWDGQPETAWIPFLRRPNRLESIELRGDPRVVAFLQAWELEQIEARMNRPKAKAPSPGQKVRHGDVVRLEARGPNA